MRLVFRSGSLARPTNPLIGHSPLGIDGGGRAQGVAPEIKFAGDSLLEGNGFEPSVPRQIRSCF
jgi:hypothetical protein